MSSPINRRSLDLNVMCQLCFDCIYDGEHFTDPDGQKWDSHIWCELMDQAIVARRNAAIKREANNQPCIKD